MKKLLITYFEPFGGEQVNASMLSVRALPDMIGPWELTRIMVPVVFGTCADTVLKAAAGLKPDAILLIGQAAGRKALTPEMFAHNLRFASIPDNAGQSPMDTPVSDGPLALKAKADVRKLAQAIRDAGLPAQVSYTAGAYVCNDLYYQILLHEQENDIPVCFIHVPGVNDGLEISQIAQALEAAICAL